MGQLTPFPRTCLHTIVLSLSMVKKINTTMIRLKWLSILHDGSFNPISQTATGQQLLNTQGGTRISSNRYNACLTTANNFLPKTLTNLPENRIKISWLPGKGCRKLNFTNCNSSDGVVQARSHPSQRCPKQTHHQDTLFSKHQNYF